MENQIKQKQIEELEKDIAVRMAMAKGIAGSMNNGVEGWLGKYLIEKGWTQIPEGAVVLTKEEYKRLEKYEKLYNEVDEELYISCRKISYTCEQLRKETAEKFAEMLKDLVAERNCNEDYDWEDVQIDGQIFIECIDEICEEISEEKK